MLQRFPLPGAALGLLVLVLLALAPATEPAIAQDAKPPAKETPAEAKRRIIKDRRPVEAEVNAAREAVASLEPTFLRFANTLRALAHRNPKFTLEDRYQDDLPLPELGTLAASADDCPDCWVELRLLALLRSGYPAEPRLLAEVDNVLKSRAFYNNQSWAEASLEFLLIDAMLSRRGTGLAGCTERALERGRALAAQRDFRVPDLDRDDITNEKLIELMHMALCRSFIRRHSLLSELPESSWKKAVSRSLRTATAQWQPEEIPLWESSSAKRTSAQRSRAALEMGVFLFFAADEEFVGVSAAARDNALHRLYQRMPETFEHKQGWRAFKGDAACFFMTAPQWRKEDAGVALTANLAQHLLTEQRLKFMRPRPDSSHMATAIGWTLAQSGEDQGMGRAALNLQQRDHLGTLCMALLAASGGLLGDLAPEEPLPLEMLKGAWEALDVLDLEDFYGNMQRTDDAIDRGAQWLLRQQDNDGGFPGGYGKFLGGQGMCVLMLLEAGVDRDDPAMRKAMARMRQLGPTEIDGNWFAGTHGNSMTPENYSFAIMQMAFAKYYEKEAAEAGIFRAKTREEFLAAQKRCWAKIPKADRDVIGHIAWAVSNNDGYGWGYAVKQPKSSPPQDTESPPDPKEPEGKGPVTGEKGEKNPDAKKPAEKSPKAEELEEGQYPPRPKGGNAHTDNSNSQYSVLGLKAAMMLGAPLKIEALAWEAERLVDNFIVLGQAERPYVIPGAATIEPKVKRDSRYADPDAGKRPRRARAWLQMYDVGCWSYHAGKGSQSIGVKNNEVGKGGPHADDFDEIVRAYPLSVAMTAAGISSLTILRDALLLSRFRDKELIERMETAIAGGLFMLGQKYPYSRTITSIDQTKNSDAWWRSGDGGPGMMYDMYSCERAGVLSGQRYFANIDWYRDGADLLIEKQHADGYWPDLVVKVKEEIVPRTVSHCFAILFLKRCAPPLSQEPPEDRRVITGEKKKKPDDGGKKTGEGDGAPPGKK